jgi:polyadenylate-binding protein
MGMQGQMMGMGPRGAMPQARPMQPQPKPANPVHPSGLDANYLASMSPEQQKNVLGERLYNYIVKRYPKQAAKITGMLLEMDNSEILNLLDSPQLLDAKIGEAMEVLDKHDSRM